ncbi:MAG: hypothetical protein II567_11145 [Candidatus Riflebacteria bacterium]|nr:hypothetical protein [Candidatus Riflebacteria bacterium]
MEENLKVNRSGKIKTRIFALILLVLSCSLALVACKSLNRSFDGMIMNKEIHNGFIQKNYDLYINPDYKDNSGQTITRQDIINVLDENYNDYLKVGVSYFAYEEADRLMIIKKEKGSPIIKLNGNTFIDQGVFWLTLSAIGVMISIMIYKQTIKKLSDTNETKNIDEEEIEL